MRSPVVPVASRNWTKGYIVAPLPKWQEMRYTSGM
jgi:hypothetical protein